MPSDYGSADFKEIGKLSSFLPSYVRHCCRALQDGTDKHVLDAYRTAAYKVLLDFKDKYRFVNIHLETLRLFEPDMIQDIILNGNRGRPPFPCLMSDTHQGLPKRACLHCPRVAGWINAMDKLGTLDKNGDRVEIKPK